MSAFHKPIRRLKGELNWLQDEFLQAVAIGKQRNTQLACEMAIVRLHDSWARFCRELIVLSAFGRTVTLGGVLLRPCDRSIKRRHLVVPFLLASSSRPNIEPRWADATKCIQAAQRLRIQNLRTVSAALASVNSPAENIRRARNFYAHRKKGTVAEALATSLFANQVWPEVYDLAAYTTGNIRIIESWVANLILVAIAAAQ